MIRRKLALALLGGALTLAPSFAQAQNDSLASILTGFFDPTRPTLTLAPPPPDFESHEAHFLSQAVSQQTLRQLNAAIVSQLSTFPLGSSSGSFTYTYDSDLGVFQRSTETFGPSFAERAQTSGRGKFSVGFGFQHANYESLDGVDLDNGDITVYLTHDPAQPFAPFPLFFKGDIIETRIKINLSSNTYAVYGNFGLLENLDIGVAVPFTTVDLDTSITAQIQPLGSGDLPIHRFADGSMFGALSKTFNQGGSASGVGDVVVRAKYHFAEAGGYSLALAGDLRLPTGDENDLLGTGTTQTKLYLVASGALGKLFGHLNVGGTFSLGESELIGDVPNEFDYTVGFDAPLASRLSIAADVIGRTLFDANRLQNSDRSFAYFLYTQQEPEPPPQSQWITTTRVQSSIEQATTTLLLGAVGLKYNLFNNFVLSGNVFVPLNDNGLRSDITFAFGGDYSF